MPIAKFADNKIHMIIDGQFGSTGKGLCADFLTRKGYIDNCGVVVSLLSPNAGHTFYISGTKHVTHMLPVAAIVGDDRSTIYIAAGSVINEKLLRHEIEVHNIDVRRVVIHPCAAVISDDHKHTECTTDSVRQIGSTLSGTGAARVAKLNRENCVAKFSRTLRDTFDVRELDLHNLMDASCGVFVETGQGYSLGIDQQFYPYVTSRNVTPAAVLADVGVHPAYLGEIVMCVRTYPIRVANPDNGTSGKFYNDSTEVTWDDVGVPAEYTTVTNKLRRVATFSETQYARATNEIRPSHVFLNFANYVDSDFEETMLRVNKIKKPTWIGHGPTCDDVTYYQKN